jgi:hypothetical protein
MREMKDYKQDKAWTIYLPLFQSMLNMTGKLKEALLLKGEAIIDVEFEEEKFTNTTIMSYQMQLAYYFGDTELAEQVATKLHKMGMSLNAHYLWVTRQFFFGMIALRVAIDATRERRKRQQLKKASEVIKELEQCSQHGGLNCLHKLLILKAELLAFEFAAPGHWWGRKKCKGSKKFESVRAALDTAIAVSARTGFRNDAALASERAMAFFRRCDMNFLADSYQSKASNFYMEWGALAKVEHLASPTSSRFMLDLSSSPIDSGSTLCNRFPNLTTGSLTA